MHAAAFTAAAEATVAVVTGAEAVGLADVADVAFRRRFRPLAPRREAGNAVDGVAADAVADARARFLVVARRPPRLLRPPEALLVADATTTACNEWSMAVHRRRCPEKRDEKRREERPHACQSIITSSAHPHHITRAAAFKTPSNSPLRHWASPLISREQAWQRNRR